MSWPTGSPEAADSSRIWVSSWDAALSDPDLSTGYARKYAASRDGLSERVAAAQELGELLPGDPAEVAAGIQAFVLGLVVQALFAPDRPTAVDPRDPDGEPQSVRRPEIR